MEVVIVDPIDIRSPGAGGVASYITAILPYLLNDGIEVTLIGISHGKNKINPGYNYISIVDKSKVSGYEYFVNLVLKAKSLRIQDNCIIHAQRPDFMFPFTLFYKKNPKMCTLHGFVNKGIHYKQGKVVGKIYDAIERFVLKRVSKVIAVNEETKECYINNYPWLKDKISVISVGIDTEKFKPMNKEEVKKKYGFNENDKIILYVGRLEKEKTVNLLIKSFGEVKNKEKNAKLVLVGGGREKNRLEELVKELKLKDVIFMGTLEHDKIPEIINCAEVFALTSLYESGPLVTQEALACGVPVVSVDVGRVREFIQNELIGKIVDRDKENIADALIHFLEIRNYEAIKKTCRETALRFSFKNTAKQTIDVYREIVVGNLS